MASFTIPDDPPFRVEYAKWRYMYSCELCGKRIAKDRLCLAKIVQSPHSCRKDSDSWYHYKCFFKIAKVTSVAQIGGMWTVAEEDQQKIQQRIEESSSEVGGADVDDTIYLREDLAVEYSKSRRAKCVRCGINIEKDVPRISKKMYYCSLLVGRGGDWESYLDKWHHVKCFIDALPDYGAVGLSPTQLLGFCSLHMETQQELMSAFPVKSTKAGKKRKVNEESTSNGDKKSTKKLKAGKKRKVNEESTSNGDKKSTKKPKMEDPEEKPLLHDL